MISKFKHFLDKRKVASICKHYNIEGFKVNDDLSVDVNRSVMFDWPKLYNIKNTDIDVGLPSKKNTESGNKRRRINSC